MIILHRLKSFARWVFRRGEVERQLHEELESFIDLAARDKIRDGVAPDEARRLARLELGGVDQAKERVRWYRWGAQLDVLLQDLRYGWRSLTSQPGFTAIIVVTLAVGIGANTAVYSVVDATLLRPLPFRDPDRLMVVFLMEPSNGPPSPIAWSYPKYETFRDNQKVFEDSALYRTDLINLTGDGEPERLQMEEVGAGYFPLLGVEAQLGRTFLPAEDAIPEQNFVAILSDNLWRRRFGADPSVIGRTIDLDLKPYTVVGVMPAGFQALGQGSPADLWVPVHRLDSGTLSQRWQHNWSLVARIKPDVPVEQAQSATTVLGRIIDEAHPDAAGVRAAWGATAEPLEEFRIDPTIRNSVLVLFGAVSFVLLIACVNVANLLLARGNSRKREIAIRCAIGAGRFRVIRQLLTESLMLGLLGGAASLAIAWASVYAFSVLNPFGTAFTFGRRLPGLTSLTLNSIHLDSRALLFTLAIAIATGIVFGLAPAFQAVRGNATDSLKRGSDQIRARHFMAGKGVLVVAEIALAFVLLAGAGLMIKSLDKLLSTPIGIDPNNTLSVKLTVPFSFGGPQAVIGFFDEVERRIAEQPGVISAGLSSCHALEGRVLAGCQQSTIRFLDRPKVPAGTEPAVGTLLVSPDYFKTMQIPLRRGRLFNSADHGKAPLVVIVNETAARRYWPGEDPIGKRVYVGYGAAFTRGAEVVGVVGDVRYGPMDRPPQPDAYQPYMQAPPRTMILFGRTEGDPVALVDAVRRHVGTLDRGLPVYDIKTMRQRINAATVRVRFNVILLTAFAVIAIVLAAVGIYGVMSFAVRQRTNEIGIRMALGARSEDVVRQVVRQASSLILIGTAIGLAGALAATRVLSSALYEVDPHDPQTYVGIVIILVAAGLLASYLPARRASRIDPSITLRMD